MKMMQTTVRVTDPHHEFFGRTCVVSECEGTLYVRPLYGNISLSIRVDQYETNKERGDF